VPCHGAAHPLQRRSGCHATLPCISVEISCEHSNNVGFRGPCDLDASEHIAQLLRLPHLRSATTVVLAGSPSHLPEAGLRVHRQVQQGVRLRARHAAFGLKCQCQVKMTAECQTAMKRYSAKCGAYMLTEKLCSLSLGLGRLYSPLNSFRRRSTVTSPDIPARIQEGQWACGQRGPKFQCVVSFKGPLHELGKNKTVGSMSSSTNA
jgi:hypothetical protein